jgi:hypothetical protein
MAAPMIGLVDDAMRNSVSVVIGIRSSTARAPIASCCSSLPRCITQEVTPAK